MRSFLKKTLGALRAVARGVLDVLVRLILAAVYFVVLFPFGVALRLATDFLHIKKENTAWTPRRQIKDLKESLTRQ